MKIYRLWMLLLLCVPEIGNAQTNLPQWRTATSNVVDFYRQQAKIAEGVQWFNAILESTTTTNPGVILTNAVPTNTAIILPAYTSACAAIVGAGWVTNPDHRAIVALKTAQLTGPNATNTWQINVINLAMDDLFLRYGTNPVTWPGVGRPLTEIITNAVVIVVTPQATNTMGMRQLGRAAVETDIWP